MIEQIMKQVLVAHAPLMALIGNDPARIDLVNVSQGTQAPFLTYNARSKPASSNLCNGRIVLWQSTFYFNPWSEKAIDVDAINIGVRDAVLAMFGNYSGLAVRSVGGVELLEWAYAEPTNQLTQQQIIQVTHT